MRRSSGPEPHFDGLTIVCTALSDNAEQGLVHKVVTHTTHALELEVKYELRLKADPGGSSKVKA